MGLTNTIRPIVLYFIERHPLDPKSGPQFRWLSETEDHSLELEALIGPYNPDELCVLVDEEPAGSNWDILLRALLKEQVRIVVTHLAPLSSAQRQQLIGICDQMGAQLITPGDAGRNRIGLEVLEP